MATVYLAEDMKHGRLVALKVLHRDLAATLGPERFRREIAIAAKLQHPHILTVLDSGQATDGRLWFTMPYIEGETLRARLEREGRVPVGEAVRMARDLAVALDYAHRRGIIHRDIKPENILLTADGQALVGDLGIAHSAECAANSETALTITGVAIGTPKYMSPEQATGDRPVGPATDVYSLGAVLYEMLVGDAPVRMGAHSARRTQAAVPEAVDAVVRRATAPVPADRFESAGAMARALDAASTVVSAGAPAARGRRAARSVLMLGLGVLLGSGALYAWRHRHRGLVDAAVMPTVAVLPFDNVGDSSDAYFADGVTDEIRGKLAALHGMQVIASASSSLYKHSTKSPETIARELGAQYLLVGRVRWEKRPDGASRVRVDPELVRVEGGRPAQSAWEQDFDADLSDVFTVQSDIATKVAEQLRVTLVGAEQQTLTARPTQNLPAYEAYLRGRELMVGMADSPAALRQACAAYREAVRLDSTFALAWAQLGITYARIYLNSVPDTAVADSARAAIARAAALAPTAAEPHRAQGIYLLNVREDVHGAYVEDSIALAARPHDARLLGQMGGVELSLGRWDDAIRHLQMAATLNPRSVYASDGLGYALLAMRRYPAARQVLERGRLLEPSNTDVYEFLVMLELEHGDLDAARVRWREGQAVIDSSALVAYAGTFYDLGWSLDANQQRLLLSLGPAAFDGDTAMESIVKAQQYYFAGDQARLRAAAEVAQASFGRQLRASPGDAQTHVMRGLALAYEGRKAEAEAEAARAMALLPITRDANYGAYVQHQAARVYIVTGNYARAIALLRPLLAMPYYLSPAWLRIDPNFAPLRGDPDFQRLVSSG
jgi:eukaryotic-like serine/threonine-protein kinase